MPEIYDSDVPTWVFVLLYSIVLITCVGGVYVLLVYGREAIDYLRYIK